MASLANQGIEALEKRDWKTAAELLSKALDSSLSPLWLIARSRAYIGTKQYDSALRDADLAYHVAADRGNRELMTEAQYRRGVAYFRRGEYANSDYCVHWAIRLLDGKPASEPESKDGLVDEQGNYAVTREHITALIRAAPAPEDKSGYMTQSKAKTQWGTYMAFRAQLLAALGRVEAGHPSWKVTATKVPKRPATHNSGPSSLEQASTTTQTEGTGSSDLQPQPKPEKSYRIDHYQSNSQISITFFVKGFSAANAKLNFTGPKENDSMATGVIVELSGEKEGDEPFHLRLTLPAPFQRTTSTYSLTPKKIELYLQKSTPGKWNISDLQSSLQDGPAPTELASETTTTAASTTTTTTTTTTEKPPVYPTSSKRGVKNWDAILQSGADGDDEADADANAFFKKLYAGASDEQRRAMQKSFLESNGTSLSTNWEDVKGRTVETRPPDGVEAKEW